MADFSNSKVGDKVYCLLYGKGEVKTTSEDRILVEFDNDLRSNVIYRTNGVMYNIGLNYERSLYHSKPQIIEAKRVVTKEVDVFINKDADKMDVIKTLTYESGAICHPAKLIFQIEE